LSNSKYVFCKPHGIQKRKRNYNTHTKIISKESKHTISKRYSTSKVGYKMEVVDRKKLK
jgi:hypothetical protein